MQSLGKALLVAGAVLMVIGVLLMWGNRIPLIGKLPGDIIFQRKNFTFYFPLTSLIILNLLILIVVWIIRKFTAN
ncbi:MAG: DUF2905 domain-containing protein [Calditrichaeota bacterium]|nr:DUF2905 domain-containing protein [Calditrichota bacterium]MCB0269433.1 DUF2905 domain-containing protein [Calditrichota bacterium]MCB0287593.1 DUF2905 domain-containing protein [Calditrichota bacterium]MCB9069118.1 DUF2905 domain-containing protein [Calditrichia bacterium]